MDRLHEDAMATSIVVAAPSLGQAYGPYRRVESTRPCVGPLLFTLISTLTCDFPAPLVHRSHVNRARMLEKIPGHHLDTCYCSMYCFVLFWDFGDGGVPYPSMTMLCTGRAIRYAPYVYCARACSGNEVRPRRLDEEAASLVHPPPPPPLALALQLCACMRWPD